MVAKRAVLPLVLVVLGACPRQVAAEDRREGGVVIVGAEGSAGQSRGADDGSATGAQLGLRAPHSFSLASSRLDLMLGWRPFRGVMGEARLQSDFHFNRGGASSGLNWGLFGFQLQALQGPTAWYSRVEVPRAHLGYRNVNGARGFEVGARAGWALAGRYNPGDATRWLGNSLTPTLLASAHSKHLYASVEAGAFLPLIFVSNRTPVWSSEALLCGVISGVAACATGRHLVGEAYLGDEARRTTSWQAGLMLGIGERFMSSMNMLR